MVLEAFVKWHLRYFAYKEGEEMSKQEKRDLLEEVKETMAPAVEKLNDADKVALDSVKTKAELALERAKASVAQSEAAKLQYDNVVLQLAMRYKLNEGDSITETGEIQRKK